jgi:phage tail P2-like protein
MTESLLPSNATDQERAIDLTTARVGDPPVPLRSLWDPETCPADLLPWLAWGLSVDEWQPSWPEGRKRAVIAASIEVHRRKGTRAAVVQAVAAAGYGDAEVIEFFGRDRYDNTRTHNGAIDHAPADHWAEYRINLTRPTTIAQAAQARRLIESVAPLRSRLKVLNFAAAARLYDNTFLHNGTFSHGAA